MNEKDISGLQWWNAVLSGLGCVSKQTVHQSVCYSLLYQMLRKKKVSLKNPGVGRIHHRWYPQRVVKEPRHGGCSMRLPRADEVRMRPLEPESVTTKLSLAQFSLASSFTRVGLFWLGFLRKRRTYSPTPCVHTCEYSPLPGLSS